MFLIGPKTGTYIQSYFSFYALNLRHLFLCHRKRIKEIFLKPHIFLSYLLFQTSCFVEKVSHKHSF